jgi:GntR family transcriptional regulator
MRAFDSLVSANNSENLPYSTFLLTYTRIHIKSHKMSDNIHPTTIFTKPHNGPLPNLLADAIRQSIRTERLKPGEQLPSEPEFAEQLGVSRTTLRDAIRMLVSDGTLERRRGIGTFVANNPLINIHEGLESLISTSEIIRTQGYEPGTLESAWETVSATEHLAQMFDIPPQTSLLHLSRTRTANGVPVIQCEEYLPTTVLASTVINHQQNDWSLYQVLKDAGLEITSAVCKVIPVVANENLAARLKVPLLHPLLLLRQTHYATEQRPVLFCENYHNCSVIEFHVLRRP